MNNFNELYNQLQTPQKIVITTHQKPDGDALGSSLGLYFFLKQLNHDVQVISPTNWPNFLNWLPAINTVIDFEMTTDFAINKINQADLIFCLDFNAFERTKKMEPILKDLPVSKKILIDHHQAPDLSNFGYIISNPVKSSTCELVFDFILTYNNDFKFEKDIATCLYTGLMTDTGSFRFSCTHPSSHLMAAKLIATGIQQNKIHDIVLDSFSLNRLQFVGYCLLHCIEILPEQKTALMAVTHETILKYNIKTGDTEGLVNYLLSIEGIEVAAIIIDRGIERKWSFRSKNEINVSIFAKSYFNGGGHINAAGGQSSLSLKENI
ncbi:MAG: bifunctional oligoribonuclease/PAP phosphatase NrnA, partial [Sediminibacterium sp.]|nr:bifunctional oligoribonuclease/PAP phosphatase NrnA [Sediminibacterium sp.]